MKKCINTCKQLLFLGIVLTLFTPISCTKPQTFVQAYYEFKDDDSAKLPAYNLESTLKFKNNLGLAVSYKPDFVSEIEKAQYTKDGGVFSFLFIPIPIPKAYFFYYDMQLSSFNNGSFKLGYARFPKDLSLAMDKVYTEQPSKFAIQLFFKQWNGNPMHVINFDSEFETSSMSINGITYENVCTIESGVSENGEDCSNVKTIYYDLFFGLIGYDETDGKEWRLSN